MNKKGFTLIELLVVVLIIAILAAIALPKYQTATDKSRLTGLMTIGKNFEDAMQRYELSTGNESTDINAHFTSLDIEIKNTSGNSCTANPCRIKVSGKEYNLAIRNNRTNFGDYITFNSYTDNAIGNFYIYPNYEDYASLDTKFMLWCAITDNPNTSVARCQKLAAAMGSTSGSSCTECYFD